MPATATATATEKATASDKASEQASEKASPTTGRITGRTASPAARKRRQPTGFAAKDWTKAKQDLFLDRLAATANVAASARAVKFTDNAVYDYRRKSAAFRAAWQSALCEGYAKLEMMMLERALLALSPPAKDVIIDPAHTKAQEYSNKLVMGLLAAHRATVRGEKPDTQMKRVVECSDPRAELERRFADMRGRSTPAASGDANAAAQ